MAKKQQSARRRSFEAVHQCHLTEAEVSYQVECFGHDLAKREGYLNLRGMEAIHYYLVQKHHWLPSQVKSLNVDDLRFLLSQEMQGWHVPEDAVFPQAETRIVL